MNLLGFIDTQIKLKTGEKDFESDCLVQFEKDIDYTNQQIKCLNDDFNAFLGVIEKAEDKYNEAMNNNFIYANFDDLRTNKEYLDQFDKAYNDQINNYNNFIKTQYAAFELAYNNTIKETDLHYNKLLEETNQKIASCNQELDELGVLNYINMLSKKAKIDKALPEVLKKKQKKLDDINKRLEKYTQKEINEFHTKLYNLRFAMDEEFEVMEEKKNMKK